MCAPGTVPCKLVLQRHVLCSPLKNETIFGCFLVRVFIPMEVCIEFLKSVFSVLCFIEVYWGLNLRT